MRTAPRLAPLLLLAVLSAACQAVRTPDPDDLAFRYGTPNSVFHEIGGMRIHLTDEGEGVPLVLLHGTAASLHTWDAWARSLRSQYRVTRYDLPPFGLSGPHPDRRYHPDMHLQVLDELLERLRLEEVVLVGNSLGGYLSALYAARNPERVRALVLVSPAGYPQELPWILRLPLRPVVGSAAVRITPRWVISRAVRDAYGDPERVEPGVVDRYYDLIRAPGARQGFRALAELMEELRHREPDWVEEVTAPTLVIWGEEDRYTPVELAERWVQDLPCSRLVVLPGVGHLAMEEAPERSLEAVRPFLEEVLQQQEGGTHRARGGS